MSPRHALRLVPAALGAALMLALLSASPLGAQTLTNSFGGLSKNSNEPIDIESDLLTVHDAKKYATFSGNVKAVQGSTTMRAKELDVHYVGGTEKLTGQSGGTATPAADQAPAPGLLRLRLLRPLRKARAPAHRSARSKRGATSSSQARTTKPPRATGRSTTCRRSW